MENQKRMHFISRYQADIYQEIVFLSLLMVTLRKIIPFFSGPLYPSEKQEGQNLAGWFAESSINRHKGIWMDIYFIISK